MKQFQKLVIVSIILSKKIKRIFFKAVFGLGYRVVFRWLSYFLVSATEVSEIVQLVFSMESLAIYSMSEVRSEHKVCFRTSIIPQAKQKMFRKQKNHLRSVTSDR